MKKIGFLMYFSLIFFFILNCLKNYLYNEKYHDMLDYVNILKWHKIFCQHSQKHFRVVQQKNRKFQKLRFKDLIYCFYFALNILILIIHQYESAVEQNQFFFGGGGSEYFLPHYWKYENKINVVMATFVCFGLFLIL